METSASIQEQIQELLEKGDTTTLQQWLNDMNISEVASLISEMPEEATQLFALLSPNRSVHVFRILDFPLQRNIIRSMPPTLIAELMNALPPDDRVAFLEEMPAQAVSELLKLLNEDERKITLSLMGYPEDSVGRIMTPDYIAVYPDWTVQDVLDYIRQHGKNSETIDVIYVIDEMGHLLEDIRIREFLLVSSDTVVRDLMDNRPPIVLHVEDKQEEAIQVVRVNNRVALPVVDAHHTLLGIVTIDDVLWIADESFEEDIQKIGGTEAFDIPYLDAPIPLLVRKRAGWLIALFLSEMLTASAMQHYQETGIFMRFADLILFIPLIMSSGGNSGSQASTLIIRAMAVGEVKLRDWWRVMRREILSGLSLGFILGTIGFFRVTLWQNMHIYNYGPHWIWMAITIFFSLIGVVLWGSLMGSMLPIILKRLGFDPAASSAPFVATLVDVTGIVIYCTVAGMILNYASIY
ncbi:MAG: magnesium transporter [Thermoflavifilum sp.]|nr:magnesium transporter [Thermoflavifilum sp.]